MAPSISSFKACLNLSREDKEAPLWLLLFSSSSSESSPTSAADVVAFPREEFPPSSNSDCATRPIPLNCVLFLRARAEKAGAAFLEANFCCFFFSIKVGRWNDAAAAAREGVVVVVLIFFNKLVHERLKKAKKLTRRRKEGKFYLFSCKRKGRRHETKKRFSFL